MTTEKIFKLTNFVPIGFLKKNYPVPNCPLCRGNLNDPCCACTADKCDICEVVCNNGEYYHQHCAKIMDNNGKK